jgi:hypothetical protein
LAQEKKHLNGFWFDEKAAKRKIKPWQKQNHLKAYEDGIKSDWKEPNSIDAEISRVQQIADVVRQSTLGDFIFVTFL